MKRKLLIMLVIFTLLFSNFAFAADTITYKYTKNSNDKILWEVAEKVSDDTYIESQYTAQSQAVDDVIYNIGIYKGQPLDKNVVDKKIYNKELKTNINNFNIILKQEGTTNVYKQWLEIDKEVLKEEVYIIYKNAIMYNNESYDIKMQVTGITSNDETNHKFRFLLGTVEKWGE